MKTILQILFTTFGFLSILIGMSQAPGGVSSGLTHWYKADAITPSADNTPLTTWADMSSSGFNATQPGPAQYQPRYRTAAVNGNPSVEFNGSSRFFNINLTGTYNNSFTIITVVKRYNGGANQFFIGATSTVNNPNFAIGYMAAPRIWFQEYGQIALSSVGAYSATTPPSIVIADFSTTSGKTITDILEGAVATGSNASTTRFASTAQGWLGRGNASNAGISGTLSEVIIYNRTLTSTEKKQIETYLSIKYGLTIPVADHLYYNDTSFPFDMFGIGKDLLTTGLNQTTSSSENGDDMLEISAPTSLDNGDYLCMGNNDGALTFSAYSGSNCRITSTLGRVWRVKETGETGTQTLKFNLSQLSGYNTSDLVLLVDNNNNGFDDDTPITGTFSSPNMIFTGVNLSNNAKVTLGHVVQKWFAVTSGNSSGAVWASSLTGTPQSLSGFCSSIDIEIKNGVTLTNDVAMTCKNLTVPAGATMNLGTSMLVLHGNLQVDGNFDGGTASVYFNGSTAQGVEGAKYLELYNVYDNNAAGVTLGPSLFGIKRLLQVNSGTFNTNNNLVLLSTASMTGAIGPLTTGDISGQVTVNRFVFPTITGWVNIAASVQGKTLADWNDDFIMSGFTGSNFPSYGFNSVMTYNETLPGGRNTGYSAATNISNAISAKAGYFVYMNPGACTIDLTGNIYKGAQNLPVTFTNSGNAAGDGWCLVGNPYPSNIDWDAAGWTKTNMANAVYIWSASTNQYATYINGVSTNGGTRYIASGQSFFVQATGANPVLGAVESVKTNNLASFRSLENPVSTFSLTLTGQNMTDETSFAWRNGATTGFDSWADAYKLRSPVQGMLYMASVISEEEELSINSLERTNASQHIQLAMETSVSGEYILDTHGLSEFANGSCVSLEDQTTGEVYQLKEGESVSLQLVAGTRHLFHLHFGAPVIASVKDATCQGLADGSATIVDNPDGAWDLIWKNANGETIHVSQHLSISTTLTQLEEGTYTIDVLNNGACEATQATFTIAAPEAIGIFSNLLQPSCPTSNDGSIEIATYGGSGLVKINWENDLGNDQSLTDLAPGVYAVHVSDEMGCEAAFSFELTPEHNSEVTIIAATDVVVMKRGQARIKLNASITDAQSYTWKMNGITADITSPEFAQAVTEPGDYIFEVYTRSEDCEASATKVIHVIAEESSELAATVSGYWNGQGVFVRIENTDPKELQIRCYNAVGQMVGLPVSGVYQNQSVRLEHIDIPGALFVEVIDLNNGDSTVLKLIKSE